MPRASVPRAQRRIVNAAFAESVQPVIQKNVLFIRTSQGRLNIESGGRGLTPAGKLYYASARDPDGRRLKWKPQTVSREPNLARAIEKPTKDGMRRFIEAPDGKRRLTMDWDPIRLRMFPTKLGKQFYARV